MAKVYRRIYESSFVIIIVINNIIFTLLLLSLQFFFENNYLEPCSKVIKTQKPIQRKYSLKYKQRVVTPHISTG